jgi:integrase
MRRGELTNWEWKDIDFERKIIKITPKESWSPKGKRGREIPINDELHDLLLKLLAESRGREVLEKNNPKRYDESLWTVNKICSVFPMDTIRSQSEKYLM